LSSSTGPPSGVRVRRLPRPDELVEISERLHAIVDLARSNTIVMDRFTGAAVLPRAQAEAIGVLGVVARASGLPTDARIEHPFVEPPAAFRPARQETGDVLARFLVRVDEVDASLALLAEYAGRGGPGSATPGSGEHGPGVGTSGAGGGSGIVEGWRGTIVHRAEVDAEGLLRRVKVVDPSFDNWPALSVALADTIVPDFPLANKSFNLSYAGNDL